MRQTLRQYTKIDNEIKRDMHKNESLKDYRKFVNKKGNKKGGKK